jgi:hypothetical protein
MLVNKDERSDDWAHHSLLMDLKGNFNLSRNVRGKNQ